MIDYNFLFNKYKDCEVNIANEIDKSGNIKSIKYCEVFKKVEELSIKTGIKDSDKCIICTKDNINFIVYYLLIYKVNSTAILTDYKADEKELTKILESNKPSYCITDTNHIDFFKDKVNTLINIDTDEIFINNNIEKYIDNDIDAKTIIYSSGTTNTKTGIVHKTSNIYEMIKYTNIRYKVKSGEKFITIVPNSHIYGLSLNTIFASYVPTSVYYLYSLDIKHIFDALNIIQPNYFCGVTKLYEFFQKSITNKNKFNFLVMPLFYIRKYTYINLGKKLFKQVFKKFGNVCLITAGSPMPDKVEKYLFGLGFPIIEFYGSTETDVPVVSTVNKNRYTYGVGKLMYPNNIKVKKETNELLVKNDYMFIDYVEKQKLNNLFDNEGYINTGDIVKVNKNGIYIVGRTKEVIMLSNGEKVSPEDIEDYFKELKLDLAVVGIKESKDSANDKIHLFVVLDDYSNINNVLSKIDEINKKVPLNMKIYKTHFVNEIPRTMIGKVQRYMLRRTVNK